MKRHVSLWLAMLVAGSSSMLAQEASVQIGPFGSESLNKSGLDRKAEMQQLKQSSWAKVDLTLAGLAKEYEVFQQKRSFGNKAGFQPSDPGIVVVDERVRVDVVAATSTKELVAELEGIGFEVSSSFGRVVSGSVPVVALEKLAGAKHLQSARSALAVTSVGNVTSQGDQAQFTDQLRTNTGLDGSGVTIGTLSDSFDCLGGAAGDVASNDLPAGIVALDDTACPASDEGRAMMQIIHDVAPGSSQAFHTAFNGQADFANGIIELATVAGADVIVDDVSYLAEPMFQDGIIAQAVDTVKGLGVAYFSSAGNNGRDSYETWYFNNSGITGALGGSRYDFDPGPGVDDLQTLTFGPGTHRIVLQWEDPFFSVSGAPGAASDLDLIVYDLAGNPLGGSVASNIGGDPVEILTLNVTGGSLQLQLGIELAGGPAPYFVKYVAFAGGAFSIDEFDTQSSTVYGHSNAVGAISVGAANYPDTPGFGVNPAVVRDFSSAGGTFIFFDTAGNSDFDFRLKPTFVAPDGGNTTFFLAGFDPEGDGFPNFPGTSAAAPHAAAVAGLLLEAAPALTPDDLEWIFIATSDDMDDPVTSFFDSGFDTGTGFGFIDPLFAYHLVYWLYIW
ncbi:MAG: S8 family serine peptidase [Acidobacteriota bacterium]